MLQNKAIVKEEAIMKELKIKTTKGDRQRFETTGICEMTLSSDFFKCKSCGYTVRMLVRGNSATCSKCGGSMVRC